MIKYLQFNRTYGTRRITDLQRHHQFTDDFMLPVESVLHTTNDFLLEYGNDAAVVPNNTLYTPLMSTGKKLCLFVDKNNTGPIPQDYDRIRFRSAGVASDIKKYRTTGKGTVKLVKTPSDFVYTQMFQNVICHEPLNRCIITGMLRKLKLFNVTLTSVLNQVATAPNYHHFLKVELGDTPIAYTEFVRSFKSYIKTTILKPEDSYWLVMMHLVGLLHEGTTDSLFEKVEKEVLDNLNIVFTCNNSFMVVSVGKLLAFREQNKQVAKILITSLNAMHASEAINVDPVKTEITEVRLNTKSLNSTGYVGTPTKEEYAQFNKEAVRELDNTVVKNILEDTTLSDKKKKYAASLAVKYKEIKVDGKSVQEWLEEPPELEVDSNEVKVAGIIDTLPDKSHAKSRINKFDTDYVQKMARRDLLQQLVSFNKQGFYLQDITIKDSSDPLTELETVVVRYKDATGTIHRIELPMPKVDSDGYCKINGNLKKMMIQRVNLPICKVAEDRVSLSSNYNKALVSRVGTKAHSLSEHIKRLLEKSEKVKYKKTHLTYPTTTLPYAYTATALTAETIEVDDIKFTFNYEERFPSEEQQPLIEKKEKALGVGSVYIGTKGDNDCYLLISGKLVEINQDKQVNESTLLDVLYAAIDDVKMPRLKEWANVTLLNTKLPIMFVLSYRFGFRYMLKYLNCTFSTYPLTGGIRPTLSATDIKFVFEDGIVVVEKPTVLQQLIVSGMLHYDLRDFTIEDLDVKDAYFDLIQQRKLSINYLRGIDTMFELFLDPITIDVLRQMHEPTNLKDLLIRAVTLITTEDHDEAAANANFRYRSYERVNAIVYKQMARAMSKKLANKNSTKVKFSISKYEVLSAISTDPLMENVDILNPIGAIKSKTRYSHLGDGGRTKDSMVIRDRRYTKDSIGVVSEAAPDNGDVGITGYLTVNPNIVNLRGIAVGVEPDKVEPAQAVSITAMLFPGANMNDGKRMNFINIQIAQYVPTVGMGKARIRTGEERMVAHLTSSKFAYPAPQAGKIIKIDEKAKYMVVVFKDGSTTTLNYGPSYEKNGGGGFYSEQNIVINNFKEGDTFKKHDILVYNSEFFYNDPFSKQVDLSLGVYRTIALVENNKTVQDASEISKELAADLEFHPTMMRRVVLKKSSVVHSIATVGTKVHPTDAIIVFDEADVGKLDEDVIDVLADLNKATPKAKYTGEVVKIEAFYKGDTTDMSPSLKKVVTTANAMEMSRAKAQEDKLPTVGSIQGDRVDFVHMQEDTVVLKFYIRERMSMLSGDKVVYGGSLKSVVSSVYDTEIKSESGIRIDAAMSATSVGNRIVLLPIYIGVLERCMEQIENKALEQYFD